MSANNFGYLRSGALNGQIHRSQRLSPLSSRYLSRCHNESGSVCLYATQPFARFCLGWRSRSPRVSINQLKVNMIVIVLTIVVDSRSRLLWGYLILFLQPMKTKPSRKSYSAPSAGAPKVYLSTSLFSTRGALIRVSGLVRFDSWLTRPSALT